MVKSYKTEFDLGDRVFVLDSTEYDEETDLNVSCEPIPGIIIGIEERSEPFQKMSIKTIVFRVATRKDKKIPIDKYHGSSIKILTVYEENLHIR